MYSNCISKSDHWGNYTVWLGMALLSMATTILLETYVYTQLQWLKSFEHVDPDFGRGAQLARAKEQSTYSGSSERIMGTN